MMFRDTPQTAFFKILIASMDEEPDAWTADRYHLRNQAIGVAIWIANGAYALHVEISGAQLNPSYAWRRRLRHAVDKCLAAQAVSALKIMRNRVPA
jgi:hypothetical protein